ncbi:hypothetical protein KFE25_011800 [Diacronema lutheri]|uniref:glutamate--tRNA ligase n=3 Tax=Diacronema lutheri TaxID=2081491 RepID=A0A8J5XGF0_DIALT|nr:hypothetical protein KFE25_011800 [Diacronema lutheri]
MAAPSADGEAQLKRQADEVRALKSSIGATKAEVDEAIAKLLELKSALEPLQKAAHAAKSSAEAEAAEAAKKANIAKAEADKVAAREKKKAAAAAKSAAKAAGADAPPADGAADGAGKGGGKGGKDRGDGASKLTGGKPTGGKPPVAAPDATSPPAPAVPPTAAAAAIGNSNREFVVRHSASCAPVLSFAAAKLGGLSAHFVAHAEPGVVCLIPTSHGGGRLCGDVRIARYFAALAHPARAVAGPPPPALPPARGTDALAPPPELVALALARARADEWLERADAELRTAGAAGLAELDRALAMRTYLAGPEPSLADAAVFAALSANGEWARAKGAAGDKGAEYAHVSRWHAHVSALPAFSALELSFLGGKAKGGSFEIDLPGAERGKVVMRFAPEPSGFLHIGHAKAALLSDHFATQFDGTLILRYDDTNPSKEKGEYEAAILADVCRLGLRPNRITHTSDYFEQLIGAQRAMIERGDAYVDPSPAEVQQKGRFARQPSFYRDAPVAESLRLFDAMLAGTEEGRQCCVRAKMDYASENGTLRDPTTFRCNMTPHHSTGERYKAYPTYDFACPWVDAHEGVTHALRDRQYKDRDAQYHRMAELLRVRRVELWSFSRMNFKMCLLSKRKLQWFVDEGRVTGWDDERMPTIQGLLRRGLSVEGLRHFILLQGASLNGNLMDWDKIWAENRKLIDARAKRFTALTAHNLVHLELERADGADAPPLCAEARSLPAHKKAPELGMKLKWYSSSLLLDQTDAALIADGEEVTLMDWGNAIVTQITRDTAAGSVTRLRARLHLAGDVKATKKKLTWLCADGPQMPMPNVRVELVDIDHLICKDSLEEDDALSADAPFLNKCTKETHAALAEPGVRTLQRGETLQVERRGYYIVDRPYTRPADPMRLIFVPDGKNMYGYRKPQL